MSYKSDLAKALLELGFLAEQKNFYGGFNYYDHKINEHANAYQKHWYNPPRLMGNSPVCGKWKILTDVDETMEEEFSDTFSDNNKVYLVTAKLTCDCEYIKGLNVFYDGTMSDLLKNVLKQGNWLED